jgi:hypothetical protein
LQIGQPVQSHFLDELAADPMTSCGDKKGIVNRNLIGYRQGLADSVLAGRGLICLTLLLWLTPGATGQARRKADGSVATTAIRATHVLGFEGVRRNANGELRIQGDAVQFQRSGSPASLVSISSIQNIALGEESKQLGGVPMMLGKAAVPFGGGRVVSLFSHKKYDSFTVEYLDSKGGLHGAIFRLSKGQGDSFKKNLVANGAHVALLSDRATKQHTPEGTNESK